MTTEQYVSRITSDALNLTIQAQYNLAIKLAANCGYQLVAEDNERSLKIKKAIAYYKLSKTQYADICIEGLEGLLK